MEASQRIVPPAEGISQPLMPGMSEARPERASAEMEPGDLHQLVQTAFNSKDVDALVELYEPNAWLFGPDGPVQGHDAIRNTWTGFVAMDAQLELVTQYVVLQDE